MNVVLFSGYVDNLDSVNDTSSLVGISKLITDGLIFSKEGTVEVEEVVGLVVNLVLNNSLHWQPVLAIANLNVVSGLDSNSITVFVLLS